MSDETDTIIDWDGEIKNDGEAFALLPDGDEVTLVVKEVERGRNKDGTKPQVRVTFMATSVNGHGKATITDYIQMTRKSEWKLSEFFRSLGLRRHGQQMRLRWDLEGMTARATVTVDSYTSKDGEPRKSNKIRKYLDPLDGGEGTEFE
jgi:hypothetical protein